MTTRKGIAGALRRLLDLLTRPVRRVSQRGPYILQPYRGYGSPAEIFLLGRVFRQPTFGTGLRQGGLPRRLAELLRRVLRWGVADAELHVRFLGTTKTVRTDRDGYFRIQLHPAQKPPAGHHWHWMELVLRRPGPARARGAVFVPPPACRRLVISDIDDTVIETGVANKLKMLWRLFMKGPSDRAAFPGMAAFLGALHCGPGGREANPMLYVSRSPWSLYEVLDEFFVLNRIPVGPLLFLREWGLTLQSPLPRRAADHKLHLIRHMLRIHAGLPVVLIGDSGQRDPEIYARIVREHPGRVLAVYIRDVSRHSTRRRTIEALAADVAAHGSSLLLATDSFAIAEHAAGCGFISREALAEVLQEKAQAAELA